jgi:SAM-dependent methyltransferase
VRREIADEVRQRRAAGEFPPSFERKLDELFAKFTPTGSSDGHFTEALKLADRSAYFDIKAPIGSRKTAKGFVRWLLWQAEAWFLNYVVTQVNHFSASVMRVLHLLDERMDDLERDVASIAPPPLPEEEALTAGVDPSPFADTVIARLSQSTRQPQHSVQKAKARRVLHADCGDGVLVARLAKEGFDAYGIDPGTAASDSAAARGLDVRRHDVLGHLDSVAADSLAGLVLSGCVDRLSVGERRRLVRSAEIALAPGGTLVVLGTSPSVWERTVDPVAADLSPGRPLHAATWAHLLSATGLADIAVEHGPSATSPDYLPKDQPGADVFNRLVDRIDSLTGGPASFAVFATKRPERPLAAPAS